MYFAGGAGALLAPRPRRRHALADGARLDLARTGSAGRHPARTGHGRRGTGGSEVVFSSSIILSAFIIRVIFVFLSFRFVDQVVKLGSITVLRIVFPDIDMSVAVKHDIDGQKCQNV